MLVIPSLIFFSDTSLEGMSEVDKRTRDDCNIPAKVLLTKRMKVRVKDGRCIVGDFVCMDPQGNLILYNGVERLQVNQGSGDEIVEKHIGQVLIPRSQRTEDVCVEVCDPKDKDAIDAMLASRRCS